MASRNSDLRGGGSELSSPTLHSFILASWVPTDTVTLPQALRGRDGEGVGADGRDGRRNSMYDVMCAWEKKGRKKELRKIRMKPRIVLLCGFKRIGRIISPWRLVMDRKENQVSYCG